DFDVVLLDIEMPRMSGLEVLREIRGRVDDKSSTPLIALTAYVMQEHIVRIEAAGADGVIAKPISGIAQFGNLINQHVGGTRVAAVQTGNPEEVGSLDAGHVISDVFKVLADTIGQDALAEFLEKVIQDFENIAADLIQAEAMDDDAAVRTNSHILISVAGAIGASNLQHLAEDLNRAARSGKRQERQVLNLQCIKGISDVVTYLRSKR
ncbi:MAG: response regulator, partial [Alphaproteobacteria bacterium]